jgi:hypothetical protein
MDITNFWFALMLACLAWYSTITIYVSIRGVRDIRHMLARLRALRDEPSERGGPSAV